MQTHSSKALSVACLVSLLLALALSVPVIERLIAAAWQWYKFSGYSNDGHISISFSIGLIFSGVLAATFVLTFALNRYAKRQSATRAVTWSRLAMYIVVAVAVVYWLLGMSGLNAWRA